MSEKNEDNHDDSTFEYEITIPETTAVIQITKDEIVEDIEHRVGRNLTDEEKKKVWDDFRNSDDFRDIFCEILREEGIPCLGASGLSYSEYFEEDVEKAIQDTVDENFRHCWEGFFDNSLEEIANEIKDNEADKKNIDEITWDNIESHTQERIQDENVKNGLARCAKELKKTSVRKWKEHYVNTHIVNSTVILPNGKNKDEMIKNIISYLT
jgi:hypothetical protein